jgi:signal transduction histidine kinase
MNLMRNGIDAINEAGNAAETAGDLAIKSQRSDVDQLLISISDTGIGLPPERADKFFDAFLTAHGGGLWATGNPDRGTTFQFTLPIGGAATAVT